MVRPFHAKRFYKEWNKKELVGKIVVRAPLQRNQKKLSRKNRNKFWQRKCRQN
jgi:hypothetical protein